MSLDLTKELSNMSNCKQCGKVVPQKEGKRERKFCSDTCRQKNWQDKKAKTKPLEEGKLYSWVGGQLIEAELPNIPLVNFTAPTLKSYDSGKINRSILDEVGQWVGVDPNYPKRNEGESGLDYKIRCSEYSESKKNQ